MMTKSKNSANFSCRIFSKRFIVLFNSAYDQKDSKILFKRFSCYFFQIKLCTTLKTSPNLFIKANPEGSSMINLTSIHVWGGGGGGEIKLFIYLLHLNTAIDKIQHWTNKEDVVNFRNSKLTKLKLVIA